MGTEIRTQIRIGDPATFTTASKLLGTGSNTVSTSVFQQSTTLLSAAPAMNKFEKQVLIGGIKVEPAKVGESKLEKHTLGGASNSSFEEKMAQLKADQKEAASRGWMGAPDSSKTIIIKSKPKSPAHFSPEMAAQLKEDQKEAAKRGWIGVPDKPEIKKEVVIVKPEPHHEPEVHHKPIHHHKKHHHKHIHHGTKMTPIERHVLGGVKVIPAKISQSPLQNHILGGVGHSPSRIGLDHHPTSVTKVTTTTIFKG